MDSSWLGTDFSGDTVSIFVYAGAAAIILVALILCFTLLRRRKNKTSGRETGKGNSRISVREVITVDERRRLVLIRRDNIEHLLLTGGDSDLVVESFPESVSEGDSDIRQLSVRRPNVSNSANDIKQLKNAREEAASPVAKAPNNAYTARPQPVPQSKNKVTPAPDTTAEFQNKSGAQGRFADKLGKQSGYPKEMLNISSSPSAEEGIHDLPRSKKPDGRLMLDPDISSYAADQQEEPRIAPAIRPGAPSPSQGMQNDESNLRGQNSHNLPRQEGMRPDLSHQAERNAFPARSSVAAEQNFGANNQPESSNPLYEKRKSYNNLEEGAAVSINQNQQNMQGRFSGAPDAEIRRSSGIQKHTESRRNDEVNYSRPHEEIKNPSSAPNTYAPYLGYMSSLNIRPNQANVAQGGATSGNTPINAGENIIRNNNAPQRDISEYRPNKRREDRDRSFENKKEAGRHLRAEANEIDPDNGFIRNLQNRSDNIGERMKEESGFTSPSRQFNPQMRGGQNSADSNNRNTPDVNNWRDTRNQTNQVTPRRISPPEDNDFDKILQDELMRSSQTPRFSPPQKKIGNGG